MEQSTPYDQRPSGYWWQYAGSAIAVILLLFLFSLLRTYGGESTRQTETDLERVVAADGLVKQYFLMGYLEQHVHQSTGSGPRLLHQALGMYKVAAERPNAFAIRRAGVLTYELRLKGAAKILDRVDSPAVLKDLPKPDIRDLKAEAQMWKVIYADGKLNRSQVESYSARIKTLNLGPVRAFALEHLYDRAGEPAMAKQAIVNAQNNAATTLVPFGAIVFIQVALGIAGVVFIGIFISNREKYFGRSIPPVGLEPPETMEPAAVEPEQIVEGETEAPAAEQPAQPPPNPLPRILFQGFLAYIVLSVVLGLAVGEILGTPLETMPRDKRVIWMIIMDFIINVLSGALALAYVNGMLRSIGRKLDQIGLTNRNLGQNVLWGIAGYCAVIPLLFVASIIWRWISSVLFRGVETPVNPVVPLALAGSAIGFVVVFIMGTVLAPFFEETFFRGMLYGGLRTRLRIAPALVIGAVAFALAHPFPGDFLPIFTIAAVFSILFETRRSLVPSMVAHALNNGFTFLMIYFLSRP